MHRPRPESRSNARAQHPGRTSPGTPMTHELVPCGPGLCPSEICRSPCHPAALLNPRDRRGPR
eukprot:10978853-Heterocapsa_arctica.AAC.1